VREEELNDDNTGEFRFQGVEEEQELMLDDTNGVTTSVSKKVSVTLSANDKWRLVKPLLGRYMLPLCTFFQFLELWFWIFCCVLFLFPLQRIWLTNLELIFLVCVYLVRTPLCGFGF